MSVDDVRLSRNFYKLKDFDGMKRLFVLLFVLALCLGGIYASADGGSSTGPETKPISGPVIIVHLPADIPGAPRTEVPISCEYNSVMNTVSVSFRADIGVVAVTVTDSASGEAIYGSLDSAEGYVVIPLGERDGAYYILFETVSGAQYGGSFEI